MRIWGVFLGFSCQPHHIVFSLHQPMGWQHGSLHGCALEYSFDLTANSADPKGLAPLWRVPAGQTGSLLDKAWRRRCAWLQQSACSLREATGKEPQRRGGGARSNVLSVGIMAAQCGEKAKVAKTKAIMLHHSHLTNEMPGFLFKNKSKHSTQQWFHEQKSSLKGDHKFWRPQKCWTTQPEQAHNITGDL